MQTPRDFEQIQTDNRLAPEPSSVLCILSHFIQVYCISSFCIALNCALRNSKSLFNDLAELLSELTINFTEHLFVSLNFRLALNSFTHSARVYSTLRLI